MDIWDMDGTHIGIGSGIAIVAADVKAWAGVGVQKWAVRHVGV